MSSACIAVGVILCINLSVNTTNAVMLPINLNAVAFAFLSQTITLTSLVRYLSTLNFNHCRLSSGESIVRVATDPWVANVWSRSCLDHLLLLVF
jgi:hypothetical protein